MEKIVWDDKYKIGVEVVDKAHEKLFRIFNKLLDFSTDPEASQHSFKEGLKYLETYTMTHFSEEEAYMRSIRYKGYAGHKRVHDNFRDKTLVSLKRDLELSDYSPDAIGHFVGIISNWVAEHIMVEDQAIVGRSFGRKNLDLSSQIAIISRAVNWTTTNLFQLEAKLDSPEYKGQNFGNGFYCSQFFLVEDRIRLQILLGLEETVLLRGTGRMSGDQITKKAPVTSEQILKIFEQMFENISKVFRARPEKGLSRENLLTSDAFRADFMKGYPCSLLFSTKVGYMIFGYRSWRLKN